LILITTCKYRVGQKFAPLQQGNYYLELTIFYYNLKFCAKFEVLCYIAVLVNKYAPITYGVLDDLFINMGCKLLANSLVKNKTES